MEADTLAELKLISLDLLDDHPQNPRVVFREDVIDSIAANLNGEWPQKHALSVRPNGERFQILAGHTRRRAAEKRGIGEVWCWVEDMDDATAYMELITSNSQGELDPLEIGIHCFRSGIIAEGKKGRGKKGGISEYAERIGKKQQNVSSYRQAAEVLLHVDLAETSHITLCDFLGKAFHLAAIHHAASDMWPLLVTHLAQHQWSVDDTRDIVAKAVGFTSAAPKEERFAGWLPVAACLEHYIDTREFSPATVTKLAAQANATIAMIQTHDVDHKEWIDAFCLWLVENSGGVSWDLRKVKQRHQEIEKELSEAHKTQWLQGKWQDHVDTLEDGSVALLLTDPPYGIDYQSDYRLDRKKPRKNKRIANDGEQDALAMVRECMTSMLPKLAKDAHVLCFCHWSNEAAVRELIEAAGYRVRGSLVWAKNNTGMGDPNTTFAPKHERIIHAVKGSPTLYERQADVLEYARVNTDRHPTEKPVPLLSRLIEVTTVKGELIADPFGGVASTVVAATAQGRAAWGCEMDEKYWSTGQDRIDGNG